MTRLVCWLTCSLCLLPVVAKAENKVPLKTEVPEETLVGTPPSVLMLLFPGLEKPPEGEPAEFLVPEGTTNVALKKPVTSSDSNPVLGELKFITDGVKEGTEESFVELAPLQQWVQIDLGEPCEISAVYVWHFFREARSYNDVAIQVSDEPEFGEKARTIYSNDQDNSLKLGIGKSRPYIETNLGKLFDAKGAKCRYVRLYSNGSTAGELNHYVEVEVFGKPAS